MALVLAASGIHCAIALSLVGGVKKSEHLLSFYLRYVCIVQRSTQGLLRKGSARDERNGLRAIAEILRSERLFCQYFVYQISVVRLISSLELTCGQASPTRAR